MHLHKFSVKRHTKNEGDFIRVSINDSVKAVELWVTKEERASMDFMEKAVGIFKNNAKDKKYRLVIFVSGTAPLLPEVKALLKYNLSR